MVETVEVEVELPPEEFINQMLAETGKSNLDDLVTDLLDNSAHKYKNIESRDWEKGIIEIPKDVDEEIKEMASTEYDYESPTAMLISWTLKEIYESRGVRT